MTGRPFSFVSLTETRSFCISRPDHDLQQETATDDSPSILVDRPFKPPPQAAMTVKDAEEANDGKDDDDDWEADCPDEAAAAALNTVGVASAELETK